MNTRKLKAVLVACVGVAAIAMVGNLAIHFLQAQALNAKPLEPLPHIAQEAMAAKGLTLGSGGPLVIVFEDPNCKYCERFDAEASSFIAQGKLRIRVVPVAFLKASSMAIAAGILGAKDPAADWAQNESSFDQANEMGGFKPEGRLDESNIKAVTANTRLLRKTGAVSTPTAMACDTQGGLRLLRGYTPGRAAAFTRSPYSVTDSGRCTKMS